MKKNLLFWVGLLFVLSVNIIYRSYPIQFPQFKQQARAIVNDRIANASYQQVQEKFANYSGYAKEELYRIAHKAYRKQKSKQIQDDIKKEYARLKDRYQDASGQTYLMELDCWHWARYVENIVHNGVMADKFIEGKEYDDYMLAPKGIEINYNKFLFYLSAYLYKVVNTIFPVEVNTFLFYLPLFFIFLLICSLYIFCFYEYGIFSAVISCLFVGLGPIFIPRSCVGWFDMDILNLLFPVLISFIYMKSLYIENNLKRLLLVFLTVFLTALFAYTWIAWPIIFVILILFVLFSVANEISTKYQYNIDSDEMIRRHITQIFFYTFLLWVMVYLICKINIFSYFYGLIKPLLFLNIEKNGQVWPNVLATVGELRIPNILDIARSVGGGFVFLCGIFSMVFLVLFCKRFTAFKRNSIFFWVLWFLSVYLLCFKGMRFTMFLLIPLGICFGWALDELWMFYAEKKVKIVLTGILAVALISIMVFINTGDKIAKALYPLMDDNWYSVLTTIKEKTSNKAVINSWWDFGDWFKTAGGRKVIFDGQSQNTPQGYWMAKVFISPSEEEVIGILKMLNNGGNDAFEILNTYFKDDFYSVLFLKKLVGKSRNEIKKILSSTSLDEEKKLKLVHLLCDEPSEAYFVVDDSMFSKMPAISYLGNWDFYKLYMYKNLGRPVQEIQKNFLNLGVSNESFRNLYNESALISKQYENEWLSSRYRFYSGLLNGKQKNNVILFDSGLVFDPKDNTVTCFDKRSDQYVLPRNHYILKDGNLEKYFYDNSALDFSVLIFQERSGLYKALFADSALAESVFLKLIYLEGRGLKHFELFTKSENSGVLVYKILWSGKTAKLKNN